MKMGTGQTLRPSTQPQIQGRWNENMLLGKEEVRRTCKGICSSWKIKRWQPNYAWNPGVKRRLEQALERHPPSGLFPSSVGSNGFITPVPSSHWDHPRQHWPASSRSFLPSASALLLLVSPPQLLPPSTYAGHLFPDYKSNLNSQ